LSDVSATACFPDGAAANAAAPVGALCVPRQEKDPLWSGSTMDDVITDTENLGCASGVCIVNHFQGRVTCPYGQSESGQGPDGTPGCKAPGSCDPVTVEVLPQCTNRPAVETVNCSCRCANAEGKTDDGASYCTCPGSMMCVQLVSPIGDADVGIAGAYCIKAGAENDAAALCSPCDPTKAP
jgi:hypothetical protein